MFTHDLEIDQRAAAAVEHQAVRREDGYELSRAFRPNGRGNRRDRGSKRNRKCDDVLSAFQVATQIIGPRIMREARDVIGTEHSRTLGADAERIAEAGDRFSAAKLIISPAGPSDEEIVAMNAFVGSDDVGQAHGRVATENGTTGRIVVVGVDACVERDDI